jgi:hypothetical protein
MLMATVLQHCQTYIITTVFHKYSLTVARHAAVVVAVPSTVHRPANHKVKVFYFRLNLKMYMNSSY